MLVLSIVFFIHLNIFTFINSILKINPFKTEKESNLVDYYISFTNYTAKTFGVQKNIQIYEENDLFKFNGKLYIYSPNIFICKNQNNNEFLFSDNYLYSISRDSNGIKSLSFYKETSSNYIYLGYIKKQISPAFPHSDSNPQEYHQYSIGDESIILYGINDKSIFFYFSEDNKTIQANFNHKINTISCNFLDYTKYLCSFDQDNQVQVQIKVIDIKYYV